VETDPEAQARIAAFRQELERLGWIDGRNIKIDYRWSGSNAERAKVLAQELVSLAPDVLLATNTLSLAMLKQATTSVPIVFVQVTDPVRGGFVAGHQFEDRKNGRSDCSSRPTCDRRRHY
jgi:putative ABC transport system substrate-binding protein